MLTDLVYCDFLRKYNVRDKKIKTNSDEILSLQEQISAMQNDETQNISARIAHLEEQIKKIIQPSITIASTGDKGAIIHFFSDISCRVLHYGTPIAITDAADTTIGAVARLLKGNHKLEYISIEHESDAYSQDYNIPDNEYETFVNIELQPIKDKRKEKEEEQKIELEQKAAEEKARRERNNLTRHDNRHKYDVFFTYSRNFCCDKC